MIFWGYISVYLFHREKTSITMITVITSYQTAFSIKLLWEYTTLMIVNKCAFDGLAASYNLTHIGSLESDGSRILLESFIIHS